MMRRSRKAFTLVELLVVIAVISVLASLLMPALQGAMASARRIICISERKQNYLQLKYFAGDHDDRVPCLTGGGSDETKWDGSLDFPMRDWTHKQNVGHNALGIKGGTHQWLSSLGTLSVRGYVEEPRLLYCPSYVRVHGQYWNGKESRYPGWHLDDPTATCGHNSSKGGDIQIYECLTNGDPYTPRLLDPWYIGITDYFTVGYPNSTGETSNKDRPTLSFYAENWSRTENIWDPEANHPDGGVSPLMLSCVNHKPTVYDSWTGSDLWDAESDYPYGTSHDAEGANAVFYDGSARWISRSEVKAHGKADPNRPDYMSNASSRWKFANMQFWAKRYATVKP